MKSNCNWGLKKNVRSVEPITNFKTLTLLNLQKILWELYIVLMDCSLVNLCWSKVGLSSSFHNVKYIISSECKIKILVKCVMSVFIMLELILWTQSYRDVSIASWHAFFKLRDCLFLFFFFVFLHCAACSLYK